MKYYLLGACLLSFSSLLPAADESLVLEGVGILGQYRYAFVKYKKQSIRVVPNEHLDDWVIEKIEPRSIFVRNKKQNNGELLEFNMDSINIEPPPPSTPAIPTLANAPNKSATPSVTAKPQPAFKPRVIKDEDVPPGHRRVRTPFGDVLVKDDKK